MDKNEIIPTVTVSNDVNKTAKSRYARHVAAHNHHAKTMDSEIKVGISACLMGEEVRYNGGHSQSKLCRNSLQEYFSFQRFCPEVAAGFETPRPVMRLVGDPSDPTLVYTDSPTTVLTDQLSDGYKDWLDQCDELDGYILMKNSPSCGLERIKIYQENGHPNNERGMGLFAKALTTRYPLLPVEEEGRLNDAQLRENFILRVFAYRRFKDLVTSRGSKHALYNFHREYKYILMAHNQTIYRQLGRLLAQSQQPLEELATEYLTLFMEALAKPASRRNHANALMHILGYLKKQTSGEIRKSIVDVIHKYRQGQVPLVAPMTLLKHYVEHSDNQYVKDQRYFDPYPEALGLANKI